MKAFPFARYRIETEEDFLPFAEPVFCFH
jgi:hypothetical protein